MITPEEKYFFYTFGFIYLPRQFTADEIEAVTHESERLWEEDRQGRPYGEQGQFVQEFVEKSPLMTRLIEDDRIYATVEALLGPGFLWNGSEGNLIFHADAPWHADRSKETGATYSFHFYLDPLRADTGCLRVIPGSHRPPLHDELISLNNWSTDSALKVFGMSGPDLSCYFVESDPGDIVIFDQRIYHAVYGMEPGRRFLKYRFVARPETDEQVASIMRYNDRNQIYRPNEAFLNSDRPRI